MISIASYIHCFMLPIASYILHLLNVYICICFGRYSDGIPALHKTELQTRVTRDLVLYFFGSFTKMDNLSKMCNLSNSCKNPTKIDKYFPFAKSNLRENSFRHLRHFLIFLLFVFTEK